MTRATRTLPTSYFDALYAFDPDPWKFATSSYEREKYAQTLAALPRAHYGSALEVGCSIGVLTHDLALRCDRLLAVDVAEAPLLEAKRRCADFPAVRFEKMFAPRQWPDEAFDLILLSEMIYYLGADDVMALASCVARSLRAEADVVMVHWTRETDYPLSGDEACELFIRGLEGAMRVERRDRHPAFRLDVLVKR
jgi:SAM-dependent methyltransferase